jgi:hypothetical protein
VGYRGRKRLRLNHNKGSNYYPCDLFARFLAKNSGTLSFIGATNASYKYISHKLFTIMILRRMIDFVKNYTNWDLGSLTIDFHAVTLLPR